MSNGWMLVDVGLMQINYYNSTHLIFNNILNPALKSTIIKKLKKIHQPIQNAHPKNPPQILHNPLHLPNPNRHPTNRQPNPGKLPRLNRQSPPNPNNPPKIPNLHLHR